MFWTIYLRTTNLRPRWKFLDRRSQLGGTFFYSGDFTLTDVILKGHNQTKPENPESAYPA